MQIQGLIFVLLAGVSVLLILWGNEDVEKRPLILLLLILIGCIGTILLPAHAGEMMVPPPLNYYASVGPPPVPPGVVVYVVYWPSNFYTGYFSYPLYGCRCPMQGCWCSYHGVIWGRRY